ncbi:MAG: hypothetical protein ACPGJS_18855 [Flammeovirgaceae bacterium]
MSNTIENIQQLLSKDKIDSAFSATENFINQLNDNNLKDDFILLSGRFHRNESNKANGILSHENYQLEANNIRSSFLHLLRELAEATAPQTGTNPRPKTDAEWVKEALGELNQGKIGAFFEKMDQVAIPESSLFTYNTFKRRFESNDTNYQFPDQLKVFANGLFN